MKIFFSEFVHDVAQSLPGQQFDKTVRHVIEHFVVLFRMNVGDGMRENMSWRPRHPRIFCG